MDKKLRTLLSDFGYSYEGGRLVRRGVRGFTSEQLVPGRFRSLFDAAEYLRPVLRDAEYSRRHAAICPN